jgi:hypothetical protein
MTTIRGKVGACIGSRTRDYKVIRFEERTLSTRFKKVNSVNREINRVLSIEKDCSITDVNILSSVS